MTHWFDKATLEGQLTGLDRLWDDLQDKTILDVGCAEGYIALECMKRGAKVEALEIRPEAVKEAHSLGVNCYLADVQLYKPERRYDIVLMLSILHKLQRPHRAFRKYLEHCDDLAVVRLPRRCWPTLVDERSWGIPYDMQAIMRKCGFYLAAESDGPRGQWTGWLRRI